MPTTPLESTPLRTRRQGVSSIPPGIWLLGLALLAAIALAVHGRIPQWEDYHHFADHRGWADIPNAADVLSNLPFLLIGCWGAWRLRASGPSRPSSRPAWRAFAVAIAFTCAGSAIYHWSPDNNVLALDRLPIAWACALLVCAFLAERLDVRWSTGPALLAAVVVGSASVAWWWFTEQKHAGDLRAYLWVQFLPMLIVPVGLWLQRGRAVVTTPLPASAWVGALLLYAAAKGFEMGDAAVLQATGFISGHTFKHLFAAGAAGWLLLAASRASDDTAAATTRAGQLR